MFLHQTLTLSWNYMSKYLKDEGSSAYTQNQSTEYINMTATKTKTPRKCSFQDILYFTVPFLRACISLGVLRKVSEVRPWVMIMATTGECGVLDLGCKACLIHPSAVTNPLQRPSLPWLTGVSNDWSSEVMSQQEHRGRTQLHTTFDTQISQWIPSFSENCRCSDCGQIMLFNFFSFLHFNKLI